MDDIIHDPLEDGLSAVQLLDFMGDDLTVVNAARVSMNKRSEKMRKRDEKLIRYLAKHNHWTPFAHVMVQVRIKMPLFVARQWFKHIVGFNRNEVSRRYVDDPPEFYLPAKWRHRAENVKQGSSEKTHDTTVYDWIQVKNSVNHYISLIEHNVAPEMARMVLPQNMYTEFIDTGSLAAWARLYNLRVDPHAQSETQQYAKAIGIICKDVAPISWEALTNDKT